MQVFHIKAPGIGPVDGGDVQPGGDGQQQAGGVGIALHPLGMGGQRGKIHLRQHFHQKIAARGAPDHFYPPVLAEGLQLSGAAGAGGAGQLGQAHIGGLRHLPAPGMEMLQ